MTLQSLVRLQMTYSLKEEVDQYHVALHVFSLCYLSYNKEQTQNYCVELLSTSKYSIR